MAVREILRPKTRGANGGFDRITHLRLFGRLKNAVQMDGSAGPEGFEGLSEVFQGGVRKV